jgi:hypothetical protein
MSTSQIGQDGIHPTDSGYATFAAVWWDAISKIQSQIQPPANVAGLEDRATAAAQSTCNKKAGNARGPVQTQQGSGHDDGMYVHKSTNRSALLDMRITKGPDAGINAAIPAHMFFAQLINPYNQDRSDALDDWIRIEHNLTSGTNKYWVRENLGGGKFGSSQLFDVGMDCGMGPHYAFADFNNDGLADFFCIQSGSAVSVSLNRGGNPPTFQSIGAVVPTHAGFSADSVRIADVDGDGRADYCLVHANGDVGCSRNGGTGDSHAWQGFNSAASLAADSVVVPGKSFVTDQSGIVFG